MSYNKTKTDPELGLKIHEHLVKMGVETPMNSNHVKIADGSLVNPSKMDRKEKIELIESKFTDIMALLGLDLSDDSLAETPRRVAKMYVNETMWGLDYEAFPKCTTVENKMKYDEMVIERNITVQSLCEHHILPIVGKATIAYVPKNKVLGLSKMPRIVEYFSRRPQIQERLTEQVFHALQYILETDNIAVLIDATHLCVSSRGVEDTSASTITTKLGGWFKTDPAARAEFMRMVPSIDQR
jgi:GTP cyclohydrolase I